MTILSSEKPTRMAMDGPRIERVCREAGLEWQPVTYHRHPPVLSTVYDVALLTRHAVRLHRQHGFDLVHSRSYVAALPALSLKKRWMVPFIFDMRGFWAEEKTEGGDWPQSNPLFRAVYRFFKAKEAEFLASADRVVTLTRSAQAELDSRRRAGSRVAETSVIPCCVDLDLFDAQGGAARARGRHALGIDEDRKVLAYLGSLGGNYMLNEMLDFFVAYRERHPGALFLFVTQVPAEDILAAARAKGIAKSDLLIRTADREEVPSLIAAADVGIAFKQASFSARACSPTKLGEMLGVGVPVIANGGVGDVDEILESTGAGALVRSFDKAAFTQAIETVEYLAQDREVIRRAAVAHFDLDHGIEAYDRIYRETAT